MLVYNPFLEKKDKKDIFKKNIQMIEFEPNSYCNRTCSFCPNSFLDRINNKQSFDFKVYKSIISSLQEINYSGWIRFARYSEPLGFKSIYDYIKLASTNLPNAKIDLVTNGDFLNQKVFFKLRESGLSVLRISIYPSEKFDWSYENAVKKINKIAKKLELYPKILSQEDNLLRYQLNYENEKNSMQIFANAENLRLTGLDRGNSLHSLVDEVYIRKSPCFFPYTHITIDYNGSILPYCNLRSDLQSHQSFIVDVIDDEKSIYDIYLNRALTEWRRNLLEVGDKSYPCEKGRHKEIKDPELLSLLNDQIQNKLSNFDLVQN